MARLRSALVVFSISSTLTLAAATRIDDPKTFVADVYRRLIATRPGDSSYTPPDDIYSAKLAKLFRDDRRKAKGGVGCLEIFFWVNGQDYAISDLTVTSADQGPDRKTVTAKFMNIDRTEENASISSAMVGARCSTKCTRLPPPLGPYLRFLKCSQ